MEKKTHLIGDSTMAKKPRDTVTYELKQGNKVVYVGTTDNPERRQQEHENSGKQFTNLKVTSIKMTEDGAKKKEADRLAIYQKNHGGHGPMYNKDSDG